MAANLPPIENQDAYLYEGEWCKEIDFLFVEVITFQARMGNFNLGQKTILQLVLLLMQSIVDSGSVSRTSIARLR